MASSVGNLKLTTVLKELEEVRWRSHDFGIHLGIPEHVLNGFSMEENPLRCIINYWLNDKIEETPVSWISIEKALRNMKENKIASRIRDSYCRQEAAVPDVADSTTLSKPATPELKELILLKVVESFNLGLRLGINESDLKIIFRNNHGNLTACSREVFSEWLRQTEKATYEQVVDALCDVEEFEAAKQLCEKFGLECERLKHKSLPPPVSLSLSHTATAEYQKIKTAPMIDKYAQLLRSHYRKHDLYPLDQWPPTLSEVSVNLALIQHESIPVEDSLSPFQKATLNGTVDDLKFDKYSIELDEILKPDSFYAKKKDDLKQCQKEVSKQLIRVLNRPMPEEFRKMLGIPLDDNKGLPSDEELRGVMKQPPFLSVPGLRKSLLSSQETGTDGNACEPPHNESSLKILIDGAPGVGKTTLTWKISQEWARGKLFEQFQLVIRISLRDIPENPDDLWQILPLGSEELRQSVVKELLDKNGQETFLILDGWDELSEVQRRKGSVLHRLVTGGLLPECTAIITSRPLTSRWLLLPRMVPRHIELFGFTQEQIKSCIRNELASDQESAERLIKLLEVRIDIYKLCYVPQNLSIVLYIYRTSNCSLPATLTQLYRLYVRNAIVNYMLATCDDPEVALSYDEYTSFPEDVNALYASLCELALWGLSQERPVMVFKEEQVKSLSPLLAKQAETLNLVTAYKSFTPHGSVQRSFQFIHATIQEFLASEAIAKSAPEKQLDFFQNHLNNPQFQMVLSFLAGITGLRHIKSIFHVPLSYRGHSNIDRLLLLVRMLYEAQNLELCRVLASKFPENSLQLSKFVMSSNSDFYRISDLDFYMLCYFLQHSSHGWKTIDAHDCSMLLMLNALKSSPSCSVRELHLKSNTAGEVYKCLMEPAFQGLKALRVEVDAALGVFANQFLSSHTLTHVHFDCQTQEGLEASMHAASKCQRLQYLGFKTVTRNRGDTYKKLILSGIPCFPAIPNDGFCFSCEKLELTNEFTQILCNELKSSPHFQQLLFNACSVNSDQLEFIFAAIQHSNLQVFQMKTVPSLKWSNEAIRALNEMIVGNTMTTLQVSYCSLNADSAVSLGQSFENNQSLSSIDLSGNRNIASSISDIVSGIETSAVKGSLVKTLVLSDCNLQDKEMDPIARLLSSAYCTVKELDLSENSIKQEGSDVLFAATARNTTLFVLNLNGNPLWLNNGDQLKAMLISNRTLLELHIHCGLHLSAITELANGIAKNSTLRVLKLGPSLHLGRTPVKAACEIFGALKVNSGLRHLALSSFTLSDEGTQAAADALSQNTTLFSLQLKRCKFGSSDTVEAFITSLYSHKSLGELAIPAKDIFYDVFSHFDAINRFRTANSLPYLKVMFPGPTTFDIENESQVLLP